MAPKEDLFKLIKSLSRTEKRYFTLDAQKSGAKNSNYIKLFKEINKMEEYDESTLKKKYANLSMDKAYLYEAILKSMRDYRSPKSKRAQMKQLILDSKFLYERALYDQCAKRLQSAKQIAMSLSDSLSLLEISREERRLAKAKGISKFNLRFDDFKAVKEVQIKNVNDEFFFHDIYDYLITEVKTQLMYTSNEDKQNLRIKFNPETWPEPTNAQSKLRFYQSKALFYNLLGKSEIAGEYFVKGAQVWEENSILRKEEFHRYIVDLSNSLSASFVNKDMATVKELLKKLKTPKTNNLNEETLFFTLRARHELNYILETKDFEGADELNQLVVDGIEKYQMANSSKITLMFQLALILMGKRDFTKSREWLSKIVSFKKDKDRLDIQKSSRVLYVLLSAEVEDYDKLENIIRNQTAGLKNFFSEDELEFELGFLTFLKSIIPLPFDRKEREELKNFLDTQSTNYGSTYSYIVINGWREANNIS